MKASNHISDSPDSGSSGSGPEGRKEALQFKTAAWLVHLLTATGGVCGLFALMSFHNGYFVGGFWLLGLAIVVDAIDGTFARRCEVKKHVATIDGALLDNIIDFLNYVIAPAFFLLVSDVLPSAWKSPGAIAVVLSSAYQFTQSEAKTDDHFFKGFPSYWNIAIFYIYLWQFSPLINLIIIFSLCVLVFVPIKYVYPTRMEHLSSSSRVRGLMLAATIIWGLATLAMLYLFPETNFVVQCVSIGYVLLYAAVSVYRTVKPLPTDRK